MDVSGYVALARQSGLWREMSLVAHNVANSTTVGYRREGLIFSEHVSKLAADEGLSMAHGNVRWMDQSQGNLTATNGELDFAIQGEGYFQIETETGPKLTRAGNFTRSAEGFITTHEGHPLLDEAAGPIFVPPDQDIFVAKDGTISTQEGAIARLGLWQAEDPLSLSRQSGTIFSADEIIPAENSEIFQGYLEESNVDPLSEIARMIEVQRAYEMAQKFLDDEDSRTRSTIQTLGRL